MQIKRHILHWFLCLLPMMALAQDPVPQGQQSPDTELSTEMLHREIGARMMQYVDEFNELAIVGNMQVSFSSTSPLSKQYVNVLKDKVTLLDERYNSINLRWSTFTQAMQMDIADDEELMAIMSNVEQLKKSIADSIASKKDMCGALQDFADAEVLLSGQDTIYRNMYEEAFKLSLVKKLAPKLEKLKARELTLFAQIQESYQKAQKACEMIPLLKRRIGVLDDSFANIQVISKKIQATEYKPFIQRIKDYLIGLACVAVLLLFINMVASKLKAIKVAREQAQKYKEMMMRNGTGADSYPTI